MNRELVKQLSKEMAAITLAKCKQCRCPLSCCSPEYCELSIEYAKDEWGVELVVTGHPDLPLMGSAGCVVEPHLRPICTVHVCENHLWNLEFRDRYFLLRAQLNVALTEADEDSAIDFYELTSDVYLPNGEPRSEEE